MKLSVVIITFNEQNNIKRAIQSISFADQVIVVDSGSTDETCKTARNLGAEVVHHTFDGHGKQKNHGASLTRGEWVLSIDADEEVDKTLALSIKNVLDQSCPLYRINRRTNYAGTWIYRGGWYPDPLLRLYRKGTAHWSEPPLHEKLIPSKEFSKKIPLLDGHLNHYSFPSVTSQITTNLSYASTQARELQKKGTKHLLWKMIFRPFFKFVECYFIKKGFLDGICGFVIAINAAHSAFMKYSFAKMDVHD